MANVRPVFSSNPLGTPPFTVDEERLRRAVDSAFAPRLLYSAALGNAATVDMPGPAAGYVRLYDDISVLSDALASALTSVTFDLIAVGGTAYRFGRLTTITATQSGHYIAVGHQELVRVVNGGSTTGRITATYIDVPAGPITLVRTTITDTPTVVVPAPAAGYFRRWSSTDAVINSTLIIRTLRVRGYNRDSVTHSLETYLGGVLNARGAAAATLVNMSIGSPMQLSVTAASGDMTLRTVAAISATAPALVGSYETLPIPT